MDFSGIEPKKELKIEKLHAVHYLKYSKNLCLPSESHNFWEFIYVDKGRLTVTADRSESVINQGNARFHKPNEWHNLRAEEDPEPNVAIISFECDSELMSFFNNRTLKVGQEQKLLLSKIISEYTNAFSTPLDDMFSDSLERKPTAMLCSEQLLVQYLCEFLILFLRQESPAVSHKPVSLSKPNSTLNIIENFMLDNLTTSITIDQLMKCSGLNRMSLNRLFKSNYGLSPMQYFINLKIEMAKKYLREDNYNISQISELLGYSSIHYFSLQFKKTTGMAPSEYSASIKSASPLAGASQGFNPPKKIETT